jgi:TIR domain
MSDILITYAHQDEEMAGRIRKRLREAGFTVWQNEFDLKTDEHWQKAIQRSLEHASNVLLLLSLSAVNSPYIARQYRAVLEQNIPLYLALVDQLPHYEIPEDLRPHHYIDLTQDFEAGIQALINAIGSGGGLATSEVLDDLEDDDTAHVKVDLKSLNVQDVLAQVKTLLESGIRKIKVTASDDDD